MGEDVEKVATTAFTSLFIYLLMSGISFSAEDIREKITAKYRTDVNADGKRELLIHDHYGGTAGFGELRIYDAAGNCFFVKKVEGDPYLWHPEKHVPALNPGFFPDFNNDGVKEIVIGYRGMCLHENNPHACVDMPWWFDVYKWNGKTYVVADKEFPGFFKEQLAFYKTFVKEKGDCEVVRGFIDKAKRLGASVHTN